MDSEIRNLVREIEASPDDLELRERLYHIAKRVGADYASPELALALEPLETKLKKALADSINLGVEGSRLTRPPYYFTSPAFGSGYALIDYLGPEGVERARREVEAKEQNWILLSRHKDWSQGASYYSAREAATPSTGWQFDIALFRTPNGYLLRQFINWANVTRPAENRAENYSHLRMPFPESLGMILNPPKRKKRERPNPDEETRSLERSYQASRDPEIYQQYLRTCQRRDQEPSICRCGNSSVFSFLVGATHLSGPCRKCGAGLCDHCRRSCENCPRQYCEECLDALITCKNCTPGGICVCEGHPVCVKCLSKPLRCRRCTTFCPDCTEYVVCEGCNEIFCENCGFLQCERCEGNFCDQCINRHDSSGCR